MPTYPTPLPQSERTADFDNTLVYFLPSIADPGLVPTRAEMTAGTDLTGEISDISGFTVAGNDIDAPDMKSEFVGKVPGRTSAEDSSITFYADKGGTDVRDVLPYKTTGFICMLDSGDVPAAPMDVFPIRVKNGGGKTRSVGEELKRITVQMSITREPAIDVAVPANP